MLYAGNEIHKARTRFEPGLVLEQLRAETVKRLGLGVS
jgi:hypothetical protein